MFTLKDGNERGQTEENTRAKHTTALTHTLPLSLSIYLSISHSLSLSLSLSLLLLSLSKRLVVITDGSECSSCRGPWTIPYQFRPASLARPAGVVYSQR